MEQVTTDPDALIRVALAPGELALAERLAAQEGTGLPAALTALWCAKEAAAKAAGTGLGGRPRDWRTTGDPGSGELTVLSPDGQPYPVRTTLLVLADEPLAHPDHVVAWTDRPAIPSPVPFHLTETSHGS